MVSRDLSLLHYLTSKKWVNPTPIGLHLLLRLGVKIVKSIVAEKYTCTFVVNII